MGRFSNLEFGGNEPLREDEVPREEPRDERLYLRLADEDHRSARFERALRHYSRALEFNANVAAAWVGQVQMLVELGECEEARLWADKALEIHRDHPDLLSVKAVAWARLGDAKRAIEFSDAALAQKGTTPQVWLARGEALAAGGGGNSEYCFEKAAAESRQDWFMHLRVGRVCRHYGLYARALAWVQKAIRREAGQPFLWHEQGECQAGLGSAAAAEASFEQALTLDPGFALSRAALERLHDRGAFRRFWDRVRGMFR
ncbi:MAG: hypothetical protein HYY17_16225 [Planctomycetes bacterium]|nr:hypothetical protein [Planctomycetota bacterium]